MDATVEQIHALIEPMLADRQMELVELTCHPQGGQWLVRLLVDHPGGVTIQACAQINRRLGDALEAANVIEGSYTIEVSSPGLDRPLATPRDFERAVGEQVRMTLKLVDGRTKELEGLLLAVQPEAVVIKTPSGHITVPLSEIHLVKKTMPW